MGANNIVESLIDYIEKNLNEDLTLDKIADDLNYSKFYIARIFSEITGTTIYKYIQGRRLTLAALKLVETKKPIIEIAYEAKYNSQQAFLLTGGAKGKRIALPNAEIMIHQPAIHGNGVQGQATDIKIISDHMQKSKERLNRILAENTGRSIEEIWIDTERDNYMSAQEALEYGVIDRIIDKR